jgi:hypothetical protein
MKSSMPNVSQIDIELTWHLFEQRNTEMANNDEMSMQMSI